MKKFIFILNCIFALIAFIFIGFFGFTDLIILFLYFAIISVVLTSIFRLISKKIANLQFSQIWFSIMLRIWAFVGCLFVVLIFFVFYQNRINPGVSPNIVLQNSAWQEIVFVNMSHIATEDFYNQKNNSLKNFSNSGFVFLVEWVKPGTSESHEIFNWNLGFNFDKNLYSNLAELVDLKEQTSDLYSGIDSSKMISIDMTMDEIADNLPQNFDSKNIQNLDFSENIEIVRNFSKFQKFLFNNAIYAILNISLKNTNSEILLQNLSESHQKLFDIILNTRNKKVVDYIISHPEEKIAIVYGALHFDGIFAEIKKYDNSWKIISVEKFFPYSQY